MEKTILSLETTVRQQHTEYNYTVLENHRKMKKMKKRVEKLEEIILQLVSNKGV
jgi:hypothetical protein